MKVADLLELRRKNWQELETLCDQMRRRGVTSRNPELVSRFAALYRAACADLALADAYHLPPNTINYLHQLVGRAHNQLYRSRAFDVSSWGRMLFIEVPRRVVLDPCVWFALALFWGLFITAALLAYSPNGGREFSAAVIGEAQRDAMEENFSHDLKDMGWDAKLGMSFFYIYNNAGIGVKCFASSVLLVVAGLIITAFNSIHLGASFGHMFRPDVGQSGETFAHFVTAHGPFELTAIVMSFAAGLRIGVSWIMTRGMTRLDALMKAGRDAMPLMGTVIALFFLAAVIEAFVSPTVLPDVDLLGANLQDLTRPLKSALAIFCTVLLVVYFIGLGIIWHVVPGRSAGRELSD